MFSSLLYNINPTTGTPVRSVWFSAICAALLGLTTFGGPGATGAIFSLGVVGQYVANSIPIAARFLGGQPFKRGPFHLGALVRACLIVDIFLSVSWRTEPPRRTHCRAVDVLYDCGAYVPHGTGPHPAEHELHRGSLGRRFAPCIGLLLLSTLRRGFLVPRAGLQCLRRSAGGREEHGGIGVKIIKVVVSSAISGMFRLLEFR